MLVEFEHFGKKCLIEVFDFFDEISWIIASQRNFYERDTLDFIFHYYKDFLTGKRYVDIGANIGNHSYFFGRLLEAKIVAFEPNPFCFAKLRRNLEPFNAITIRKAVYNISGKEMDFAFVQENVGSGTHYFFQDYRYFKGFSALTITLDELEIDGVDFLKMDCEGDEMKVFEGGFRTLKKFRPIILIEETHEFEHGMIRKTIQEFLEELGYVKVRDFLGTVLYEPK